MRISRLIVVVLNIFLLWTTPAFARVDEANIRIGHSAKDYSYFGIKTNLLYDAVLVPNIGLEINVYDNITVYGDIMYADWNMPAAHFYWNFYGAQIGARKYFGRLASERSISGHHIGIYGQATAYDLQAGNIGQQTPEINYGAGAEYGYSFPVARSLNIDVELGVGYLTGKYYEYVVHEGHYTWRGTINRAWFGPTKASVSLIWLIKPKKKNRR